MDSISSGLPVKVLTDIRDILSAAQTDALWIFLVAQQELTALTHTLRTDSGLYHAPRTRTHPLTLTPFL